MCRASSILPLNQARNSLESIDRHKTKNPKLGTAKKSAPPKSALRKNQCPQKISAANSWRLLRFSREWLWRLKTMESDQLMIERLLSDFAWFADRGDATALSELFIPDGVLLVSGNALRGRVQIAEDCIRRFLDPNRRTRHFWSNLRIDRMDGDTAASFAIQLTFEQSGAGQPTQLRVNDLVDEFQRDSSGSWKIARRVIERKMALSI
jgi:ketosteroid isomerase-like protein